MIFVAVSTGHFDPLIRHCAKLAEQYDFFAQIGSGEFTPPFPHFRTAIPQVLEDYIREAELVVSHAGTGMLSMIYRQKKRAVVIPKQKRYGEMNNGQIELAKKWTEMGMAILCMDVNELSFSIEKCRNMMFHRPALPALGDHLKSELGIESTPPFVASLAG